ncbi:MAG TPA: hypothetical protein VFU43_00265 [Streptosporangiaceae bacterium]|nr:hypothetical protein [Streptosporangiaceae bacterium]
MRETWAAVDRYITELLVPSDAALDAALEASAAGEAARWPTSGTTIHAYGARAVCSR